MSANPQVPTDEIVARAWHALSDEAMDGIPFDGRGCTCRNYAPHAKQVLDLFTGEPVPEPDGLGAVVVNPFTDQVFVRAAHPRLPWHDPAAAAPQQWADPTCEDWFVWADLPRPLVMQSPGWKLPSQTVAPRRLVPEPTGIGAVVVDTGDEVWVRLHDGERPWVMAEAGVGQAADWDELARPVTVRSHGWTR